jgi:hypothetical protein
LSQQTTFDSTVTAGNVLHILTVAADGTLTETVPDVALDVRPQGVVVR